MTIQEMIDGLLAIPEAERAQEISVWLPGSQIKLGGRPFHHSRQGWLVEGNLTPESALARK